MSTVPANATNTTLAPPSVSSANSANGAGIAAVVAPAGENPAPVLLPSSGFFNQPSTRLDLFKFLVPFLLAFIWAQFQQYAQVQGLRSDVDKLTTVCAAFQSAKEDRGDRMARLETGQADIKQSEAEHIAAVRADIAELRAVMLKK